VMGAVQPRFQVCEDEMDDWQILLGDLRISPFTERVNDFGTPCVMRLASKEV
jgi:hypothetical protein